MTSERGRKPRDWPVESANVVRVSLTERAGKCNRRYGTTKRRVRQEILANGSVAELARVPTAVTI